MSRVSLFAVALLCGLFAPAFAQLKLQVKEKSSVKAPYHGTAISPDGKLVARPGGFGVALDVYEVSTGEQIASVRPYLGQGCWGTAVTFSADGSLIAGGGGGERESAVVLWDVKNRKQAGILRLPGKFYSLAFHPDGKTLAIGIPGGYSLWDVVTGKERAFVRDRDFPDFVPSLSYSHDGKVLYFDDLRFAGWDTETEMKRILPEGRIVTEICGRPGDVGYQKPLLRSPDGTVLVTQAVPVRQGDKLPIKLWDLKAKRERGVVESVVRLGTESLIFSPDGKLLAVQSEKDVELVSVETGKRLTTIEGGRFPLVFGKDGKTLTGFWNSPKNEPVIKVWELTWVKEPGK